MNSQKSNFNYSFTFKEDQKKTQTIIEFNTPPERKNLGLDQEEINKIEKFAFFVNRMITGNKNSKEFLTELNPVLISTYRNYPQAKLFSSIQLVFNYFGSLPENCLEKDLQSFESNFNVLYCWCQKILFYLIEVEKRNYILETIEIEQIVLLNNNLKIVPNIERIRESYLIKSQNVFTSRGSDGEAPELYKGTEKSNLEAIIDDPRKLIVYSFGILALKLFNLLEGPDLAGLKVNKKSQGQNDIIIQISKKIVDKYQHFGNIEDLIKFSNLIQRCLSFSPKERPYLEEVSTELTSINFGTEEYTSIMVFSTTAEAGIQTIESKDSSKNVKSIENSKISEIEQKGIEDVLTMIIKELEKDPEGKVKDKGEILNNILNINFKCFEYYYSNKTVWNFIHLSLTNMHLNFLENLVIKSKLSVTGILLGASIDRGYTKAILREENKILFNEKTQANFKKLMLIIQKSESLKILKLDNFFQFKDKFKSLVKSIESSQKLEELSLNFNSVHDEGLDLLISSVKLSNLKILNLYGVDITNESADRLFKMLLDNSKNLHSINIGGNIFELNEDIIASKQMDNFFKFLNAFKLKFFNLSGSSNAINPFGIKEIVKTIKKQNLEYLNLGDLDFDYESMINLISSFKEMPKLKFIDASHDPMKEIYVNENQDNLLNLLKDNLSMSSNLEMVCLRGWCLPIKFLLEFCKKLQVKIKTGFQELDLDRCSFIPGFNEEQIKDWFSTSGFTFALNFKN